MANIGEFWIADDVVAHVQQGDVTICIGRPTRSLPKEKANKVANEIWLSGQLRQLELARRRGETIDIPLTDRFKQSSLRLGGGFLIVQGKKIVLIKRTADAPRRASELCECGGVFEVNNPDPYDPSNDFIASLLKETAELALVRGDRLYVPVFAIGDTEVGFHPPGLNASDLENIVSDELVEEAKHANLPIVNRKYERTKLSASILNYERSARLHFADSISISVDFTAETDSSSLEFVGVVSYPEDVDLAALTYYETEIKALEYRMKNNPNDDDQKRLIALTESKKVLNSQLEKKDKPLVEYWDTESFIKSEDPKTKKIKREALNREIWLIDIQDGKTDVWFTPEEEPTGRHIDPNDGSRTRSVYTSNLWTQLSKTNLIATGGRHVTEKAEKAIKMHCPLPWLQPLITL